MQFDLLRKCGLLAHASPTFLKNCWIKKLLFCLRHSIHNAFWKAGTEKALISTSFPLLKSGQKIKYRTDSRLKCPFLLKHIRIKRNGCGNACLWTVPYNCRNPSVFNLICYAQTVIQIAGNPTSQREKLLHRKTFQLPAARILQPTSHLFISPAFPCFCETVNNIVHYPILYAV